MTHPLANETITIVVEATVGKERRESRIVLPAVEFDSLKVPEEALLVAVNMCRKQVRRKE